MIDPKEAVQLAKDAAVEMLSLQPYNLEEIEREDYQGHDAWSITLSFPKEAKKENNLSSLAALIRTDMFYKRFLIDADTGRFLAMKIREPALP